MSSAAVPRRWGPVVLVGAAAFVAGWAARVPDAPVPRIVLRTIRGPTTEVPAAPYRDPVSTACADEDRLAVGLLGLNAEAALDPPLTESACRARVALATAVTTGRQLDRLGTRVAFPEDLPDEFREAAIAGVAREVDATCPGLDLRRVDCSEFPCLALFVSGPGEPSSVAGCPAWTEAYGSGTTSSSGTLVGADGAELRYELVGPQVPSQFLPPPEPQDLAPAFFADNATKRLLQRGESAKDEVMAALGARERTVAEQREVVRQMWTDAAAAGNPGAAWILESLEVGWAAEDAQ